MLICETCFDFFCELVQLRQVLKSIHSVQAQTSYSLTIHTTPINGLDETISSKTALSELLAEIVTRSWLSWHGSGIL